MNKSPKDLLKLYCSNFRTRYYLREIAKLTNLSLRTAQRLLFELEKKKIMKSKREGKNKYYALNLQNIKTKFYLLEAEINKTLELLDKYPIFQSFLKENFSAPLIVFGSFAEFKATKESDLDLLIIANEKIIIPKHLLPYEIHEIKLNEKTFQKALKKNEPLIKEILKNHIILTGHSYFVDFLWDYYGKY